MPTNQLMPFANGEAANVIDFTTWNTLPQRVSGFGSGIARSDWFNRILAQGGTAGYVLGQFVVDYTDEDATINATALYEAVKQALASFIPGAIADKSIASAKIADKAITTAKLADGAVNATKIADGAVTATQIADGSVGTNELANDSVTQAKIASNAVGTNEIANGAVTAGKLGAKAVESGKIADGAVTATQLANDAVTQSKIASKAVGTNEIADGAIGATQLGSNAVTNAKIANSAVTGAKIANSTISTDKLSQRASKQDIQNGTSMRVVCSDVVKQYFDVICPPGMFGFFHATDVPEGWLLCNGAAVSRTTYSRLFAKIGTKYGSGNGSSTFNLPNLNDRVLQGTTNTGSVGNRLEAALPNIKGEFRSFDVGGFEQPLGAFYIINQRELVGASGSSLGYDLVVGFNASGSNSSYSGTKLQPSALQTLPCIRY